MGRFWLLVFALTLGWKMTANAQQIVVHWLSRDPTTAGPIRFGGRFVDSRFPSVTADGTRVIFQVDGGKFAQIWASTWDGTRWQTMPVLDGEFDNDGDGSVNEDPFNGTDDDGDGLIDEDPPELLGLHPVVSADGHHLAFSSYQDYRPLTMRQGNFPPGKAHVYVFDRRQGRIVPISFQWLDTDDDGARDSYAPSLAACIPVAISADGRVVAFLAEWLPDTNGDGFSDLNIVDENGDGIFEAVFNPPSLGRWLLLIHDRDADGNGILDEVGLGATATRLVSLFGIDNDGDGRIDEDLTDGIDNDGDGNVDEDPIDPLRIDNDGDGNVDEDPPDGIDNDGDGRIDEDPIDLPLRPAAAQTVAVNGRFAAFVTTYDNDGDLHVDEDPADGTDNDEDGRTDEDPRDERWQVAVRDWQSGSTLVFDDAMMPSLSDDALYVAFFVPDEDDDNDGQINEDPIDNADNDGDGRVDEDPPNGIDDDSDGRVDEDPINGTDDDGDGKVDEDPRNPYLRTETALTVVRLIDGVQLQLQDLNLSPSRPGTTKGISGTGYSDWWSTLSVAVDPTNPNFVYVAFHSWATNLIDPQSAPLTVKPGFYQGVANIFLSKFDFENKAIQLLPFAPDPGRRGLPISLVLQVTLPTPKFRLPLASSLMPSLSFVQPLGTKRLFIVFQSLAPLPSDWDGDGRRGEDPIDGTDNDGDGQTDEDPPDTNGHWDVYLVEVPIP